jgi:hypothetical protein
MDRTNAPTTNAMAEISDTCLPSPKTMIDVKQIEI